MAEKRGKALKEILNKNKILQRECELLEVETETLKQALQEATEVIKVLNVSVNYKLQHAFPDIITLFRFFLCSK